MIRAYCNCPYPMSVDAHARSDWAIIIRDGYRDRKRMKRAKDRGHLELVIRGAFSESAEVNISFDRAEFEMVEAAIPGPWVRWP